MIRYLTVFCGSNNGNNKIYTETAYNLGAFLAKNNICLVYGGAKIGIMGSVAQGVMDNGGKAIGIIPNFLTKKEVVHNNLTELIVTKTMQERKHLLYDKADAYIVLPGGIGTLDELSEVLGYIQLSLINKPIGLLNINKYFDSLLKYLKHTVDEKLMPLNVYEALIVDKNYKELLTKLNNTNIQPMPKWIDV